VLSEKTPGAGRESAQPEDVAAIDEILVCEHVVCAGLHVQAGPPKPVATPVVTNPRRHLTVHVVATAVSTGLDVQTGTNDMFAYQDLVDSGDILGPARFLDRPRRFSDNNFQSAEEVKVF